MPLFAATIALSAFLLFLVQPVIAKQILPWFGGSAAVWTTCMVFFQVALLAGYAYSDFVIRRLAPRSQAWLHGTLVAASLAFLPITPSQAFKPENADNPVGRILLLLAATIGLPYLILSTTGPLVQAWFARSFSHGRVYRLYALSNAASMLALVAYPPLIEPLATSGAQSLGWSAGYAVFAALAIAAAWRAARAGGGAGASPPRAAAVALTASGAPPTAHSAAIAAAAAAQAHSASTAAAPSPAAPSPAARAPSAREQSLWLALAALGSILLLAVTTHITQNVASIPFLWVLPLAIYLATFILCFDGTGWYWRRFYGVLGCAMVALMLAGLGWRVDWGGMSVKAGLMPIDQAVPLYAFGLFVLCMFCHGELVARKPAPAFLTRFYLMISLGGALGGVAVGIVAPLAFDWYWELPLALAVLAGMILFLGAGRVQWVATLTLALALVALFAYQQGIRDETLEMSRNFYGVLRVKAAAEAGSPDARWRLLHGVITHGEQYRSAEKSRSPTTYYGPSSGVARAIEAHRSASSARAQRVGLVGLGTGTLATYGREGDVYRAYELDPAVVELARTRFSFLSQSRARVETALGDARLVLEREPPQRFDLLAVDAFSSDSIPVHLITREAIRAYRRHVVDDGVIAFHISNRYLDLTTVVLRLAEEIGWFAVRVVDDPGADSPLYRSDWVLITANGPLLAALVKQGPLAPIVPDPGLRAWTDDFNNLFRILK